MPKRKTNWITWALVAATGYGAYSLGASLWSDATETAADAEMLANQLWIERMPNGSRDAVGHLTFVQPRKGKRVGAVGRSSRFRFNVELFAWSLEGQRLALFFPQERVKAQLEARTWACEGEAPEPFELCLELSANGRSVVFYSRKDWVIRPRSEGAPAAWSSELGTTFDASLPAEEFDVSALDLAAFETVESTPLLLPGEHR